MSEEAVRSLDVKVNSMPTEMGIRLDIHSPTFNLMVEFDPQEDPVLMQSVLACLPQLITHSLERLTAPDSPVTAHEWWQDGLNRMGEIRAEKVD